MAPIKVIRRDFEVKILLFPRYFELSSPLWLLSSAILTPSPEYQLLMPDVVSASMSINNDLLIIRFRYYKYPNVFKKRKDEL
jgi:hypothetical protein